MRMMSKIAFIFRNEPRISYTQSTTYIMYICTGIVHNTDNNESKGITAIKSSTTTIEQIMSEAKKMKNWWNESTAMELYGNWIENAATGNQRSPMLMKLHINRLLIIGSGRRRSWRWHLPIVLRISDLTRHCSNGGQWLRRHLVNRRRMHDHWDHRRSHRHAL